MLRFHGRILRLRWLCIGAAVALISLAASNAQSYAPGALAPAQARQFARTFERKPNTLLLAAMPGQPESVARERAEEAELDHKLVDFNGRVAFYTWCLALIAALQFIALIVQAYFLWRNLRIARASADALPALERAYVFVKPKINLPLAMGWNAGAELAARAISVKYSFTNHGKTPAIVRAIDARVELSNNAPNGTAAHPVALLDNEPIVDAKRSTDPDEVFIERTVSGDEVKALKEGRIYLWFYGSILYEDISKKQHLTRFRWRYEGAQQHFAPDGAVPFNDRN